MTKRTWRIAWAVLALSGAFMLYVARYGALWQYDDLGWFQWYVLRPGMYLLGAASLAYGLWTSWLRYTLPARVLRSWWRACQADRELDKAMAGYSDEDGPWTPRTWRDDLRSLWFMRRCMAGNHDPNALWYSDGGEDGPRGTTCADCGLRVSLANVVPPLPRLTEAEYRQLVDEAAEYDILPSNVVKLWPDGGPDPLRHLEPDPEAPLDITLSPDCESRYAQGSVPTVRNLRDFGCDKEA